MHAQHIIVIVLLSALILPISISMISNNQLPTNETIFHYDVSTMNDEVELDDDKIAVAEYVSNSSSILIGDVINCIDLVVSIDEGSPVGNAIIGTFDNDAIVVTTFATVDVTTFMDEPSFYTYCFSDYTIQDGDRIGIAYTGTMDDTLWIHTFDPSSFDGFTTRIQQFETLSETWGDGSVNEDLTMRLYFVGGESGNFDGEMINNLMMVFILLMVVLVLILLIRLFFNE